MSRASSGTTLAAVTALVGLVLTAPAAVFLWGQGVPGDVVLLTWSLAAAGAGAGAGALAAWALRRGHDEGHACFAAIMDELSRLDDDQVREFFEKAKENP